MERKVTIDVNEVFVDANIYPRDSYDWQTVHTYKKAMESGAKFPPIVLAMVGDIQNVLIDGKQRLDATKQTKQKNIVANHLGKLSNKDAYIAAIECNITHGRPLSYHEKLVAIDKLIKLGVSREKISNIIRIPMKELAPRVAERTVRETTGQYTIVKAPLAHLGRSTDISPETLEQDIYSVQSQLNAVKQVVSMIENGQINKNDDKLMTELQVLSRLLKKLFS